MIRVLDKQVADKIAAGEVVDRPLSVVKELVENAVDAGADAIVVEIRNGGKSYIRVTDNGCGIPSAEAVLAFERHATSKITSDKDLQRIETLGFRGEALASIAAVSRTELITKTSSEKMGTKVRIDGGHLTEQLPTGCPDGTSIIVTDLYYNTPARLKFMKSDGAESGLIIDFVSQMALAYANIKIRLVNNGTILFSTQGKGSRYDAILTVYSPEVGNRLIPVHMEADDLSLEGYVSSPDTSKTTRRNQIFFVNGRVISSKVMDKGVANAYTEKLFEGRYPIAFLFLKSAPEQLDVNIHPNKKEVRFDDEKRVIDFISMAIRRALATKEAVPEIQNKDLFKLNSRPEERQKHFNDLEVEGDRPEEQQFVRVSSQESENNIKSLLSTYRNDQQNTVALVKDSGMSALHYDLALDSTEASTLEPVPFDMASLQVTGAIFGTYITAVDEDCFYLIDQHAAHERILAERLMGQYYGREKLRQAILIPFVVTATYGVSEQKYDWLDALTAFGFEIEEFGPKSYIVKAVPAFIELEEAREFIDYFLENITDHMDLENMRQLERIISKACKAAVKARDFLSPEEIRQLMADLSRCEHPYFCPHGRPTFIKMTKQEIERMFKRI